MRKTMKCYRLSEWELESIETLKIMLQEKYKIEFTATDIVCRAINEMYEREYKEYLAK